MRSEGGTYMAMLSDSERMEIIRECTLEDDVFFSLCLENSTDSVSPSSSA